MHEIKRELHYRQEGGDKSSFLFYFTLLVAIGVCAIFIGELLFGKNSLEVYQKLKVERASLKQKIEHLKRENAKLQKKYFELKSILPSESEDE